MRWPAAFLGTVATLAGLGSVLVVGYWTSHPGVLVALLLHGGAAFAAVMAARARRGKRLSPAEFDAVLQTAALVPFLGPALAWTLPRRAAGRKVENAHQVLERYLTHVKPVVPVYERTLFTGDLDRDIARKLDLESYAEVLRHGETDQKRSALFRLAEMGEPQHLSMIRRCLTDDDQEVRLYAYGELDRLTRVYENRITQARKDVADHPEDAEAHKSLARAHLDLAASGILDNFTARFHFRVSARHSREAQGISRDADAILLEAMAYSHAGEVDQASACLDRIPDSDKDRPEICLARAELALMRRDFDAARSEVGLLLLMEVELPPWLAALCDRTTPKRESVRRAEAAREEAPSPEVGS